MPRTPRAARWWRQIAWVVGAAVIAGAVTVVAGAAGREAPGAVEPSWVSLRAHYQTPAWLQDGKFGLEFYWGLFAVPAAGDEDYYRRMYGTDAGKVWHLDHYGSPAEFGYKDFIPLFKAEKFDATAWVALAQAAGARYVVALAEGDDGFALWDSTLTPWNAAQMGPRRDVVGEVARAAKSAGLHFGVANGRISHFTLARLGSELATDLTGPAYDDFYWTWDRSEARRSEFLNDWQARNRELINKYQPDLLELGALRTNAVRQEEREKADLAVAAYFYNEAAQTGRAATITAEDARWLAGAVPEYVRGRAPQMLPTEWEERAGISTSTFGFVEDMKVRSAAELLRELADCVSKNGDYLLTVAPRADGAVPDDQEAVLKEMGAWLKVNGEAIYGTRPWVIYGEGPTREKPDAKLGYIASPPPAYTGRDLRFTTHGDTLYAILMGWPAEGRATIAALAAGQAPAGKIGPVELLGHDGALAFAQDAHGLEVQLPAAQPGDGPWVLKITGLKLW